LPTVYETIYIRKGGILKWHMVVFRTFYISNGNITDSHMVIVYGISYRSEGSISKWHMATLNRTFYISKYTSIYGT
jgi:hypothetical protein